MDAFVKHFPCVLEHTCPQPYKQGTLFPKEKAVLGAFLASFFFLVSGTMLWNPVRASSLLGFFLVTYVGLKAKANSLKSSLCLLFINILLRFKKKKKVPSLKLKKEIFQTDFNIFLHENVLNPKIFLCLQFLMS